MEWRLGTTQQRPDFLTKQISSRLLKARFTTYYTQHVSYVHGLRRKVFPGHMRDGGFSKSKAVLGDEGHISGSTG